MENNNDNKVPEEQPMFSISNSSSAEAQIETNSKINEPGSSEKKASLAPHIQGHIFKSPGDMENSREFEEDINFSKKNEPPKPIYRIVVYAVLIFIALYLLYFFFFRVRTIQIFLDNDSKVKIPSTVETAKLVKSGITYTLKKQEDIKNKEYLVVYADDYWYSSLPSPRDACSKVLYIIPADDSSAKRGMENFREGRWEIKTEADKKRADQMINDVNRLNEVRRTACFLPADDFVRDDSRKIRDKDIIIVSGMNFEITDPKDPEQGKDIFMYATELKIKK